MFCLSKGRKVASNISRTSCVEQVKYFLWRTQRIKKERKILLWLNEKNRTALLVLPKFRGYEGNTCFYASWKITIHTCSCLLSTQQVVTKTWLNHFNSSFRYQLLSYSCLRVSSLSSKGGSCSEIRLLKLFKTLPDAGTHNNVWVQIKRFGMQCKL